LAAFISSGLISSKSMIIPNKRPGEPSIPASPWVAPASITAFKSSADACAASVEALDLACVSWLCSIDAGLAARNAVGGVLLTT